ncbi:hypothetical protein WJX79_005113 [Trebouxia sp. C0005]
MCFDRWAGDRPRDNIASGKILEAMYTLHKQAATPQGSHDKLACGSWILFSLFAASWRSATLTEIGR